MTCLSVRVQVDEEHVAPRCPPPTHPIQPTPLCARQSQGIDCRSRSLDRGVEGACGGIRGHPRPIPKNLHISAYSASPAPVRAPALEMCSVKPWRRECPKHSADESGEDRVGIHLLIINPWGLLASLRAHAAFGIRK